MSRDRRGRADAQWANRPGDAGDRWRRVLNIFIAEMPDEYIGRFVGVTRDQVVRLRPEAYKTSVRGERSPVCDARRIRLHTARIYRNTNRLGGQSVMDENVGVAVRI